MGHQLKRRRKEVVVVMMKREDNELYKASAMEN